MTMLVAWVVLPLFLALVSLGCGLLLEVASGMRLPGPLLLPGGFIVVSLAAQFPHMFDATAKLQAPLVIGLAVTGYAIARPWKRFQVDRWLTGAATGVYLVFGAPVLLSGSATFLGYVRLDDTAIYQSMLDRAVTHGYDVTGIPTVSTYYKALLDGYVFGYPLGSFLPLGTDHTVLTIDTLWLWQPYLTFIAVMIALGLYQLVSGFVQSRPLRACVAFFGTQAALMYGYALWGGVKELFVAAVVIFLACLVPGMKTVGPRQMIPLAAASAAVIGGESAGGGIWIVPAVVAAAVLLVLHRPPWDILKNAGVYAVCSLGLAIPILSISARRLHHIGKFTSGGGKGGAAAYGNLYPNALSWWHLPGIWPSGDFRTPPASSAVMHILAGLVVIAAGYAVVMAWRSARWEIVVALATALFSCLVYVEGATPWVGGKALAASSPLVLGIGLAGVAVLVEGNRQIAGGIALAGLAVIAGGVLWSNVMQYRGAVLAPAARLMELEKIGHQFSGKGPALMAEYEPYGVRHFLRGLNAEGASELRVSFDYLRNDSPGPKQCPDLSGAPPCYAAQGVTPDVDELQFKGLLYYRLLVLRKSATGSRPSSVYTLAQPGHYYDVWERTGTPNSIVTHVPFGTRYDPAAVPSCRTITDLGQQAAAVHGVLKTVIRPETIILNPRMAKKYNPTSFGYWGEASGLAYGTIPYRITIPFFVNADGDYTVWVGGSFSSTVTAKIDGQTVGQQRNQTEWPGNFLAFGSEHLVRGHHMLRIRHDGPDWRPGSAAVEPFGLGPFVIAKGTEDERVTTVQPSDARSLCGKSLDWIEVARG
jgi:hypothetical protein